MTISTEPVPLPYNGDGVTVNFAISWKYFSKSDVRVTHRSSAGVEMMETSGEKLDEMDEERNPTETD